VLARIISVFLGLLLAGCISGKTGELLDRSYENAGTRLVLERRPASPTPDASGTAAPTSEAAIVAEVVAKSPILATLAHRARALVHEGRAEGSLPNAELGFEAWNLPIERPYALDEADMYMVELKQRFPAAGSLDGRARALAEEAQAVLFELETEERIVRQAAAEAYANYVQAHAARRLEERQLELLRRMGEVIAARFSTGGSGLIDSTRLGVEVSRTERALARARGDIARAEASLLSLLRRTEGELGEPEEAAPETVRLTVPELLAHAEARQGALSSAEARLRAAEARRAAAVAEARVPEFMAGLGYWQDPTMRPGFGLTSSMSLPWLWGPGRQRVLQRDEEKAAEQAVRDGVWLTAHAEISETHASLRALEAEVLVITQKTLPALRRSLDALSATFATGNAPLLEWIDVARSVLDLELELVMLRGDLARGIANLERAVGAALPRSPVLPEGAP